MKLTALCITALLSALVITAHLDDLAKKEREAAMCMPHLKERAILYWQGGKLQCTIIENIGYGMAPRLVRNGG